MMEEREMKGLSGEAQQALDTLLAQWTQRHALPTQRAELIRQAALQAADAPQPELTYEWWNHLFSGLRIVLEQSTRLPAPDSLTFSAAWFTTPGLGGMNKPKRAYAPAR